MFIFGLKMLWEAWRMKPDEIEDLQQEVQEELQKRGSIMSGGDQEEEERGEEGRGGETASGVEEGRGEGEGGGQASSVPLMVKDGSYNRSKPGSPSLEQQQKSEERNPGSQRASRSGQHREIVFREKSVFGKKCYKIFKLFLNCFTMTFLAEWGDRSQLATVVLASVNDVTGVCVGGVLGHACCTGLAVIAGAIIAKKISVRMVTFIGAIVFLAFAVASLFFDPESQELINIDI